MKLAAYAVLLTMMVATGPAQAVELVWHPEVLDKLEYAAAAEIDVSGLLGELNTEEWQTNQSAYLAAIDRLKQLPLPDMYLHHRAHFKALDNGKAIRVQLVGVPVTFNEEPKDEHEMDMRDRIDAFTNAIMLQGDMDLSGNSADLTFYRSFSERNIMTQFFYLPNGEISVGDHWQLPVQYIELGPGIFVQSSSRHNQVTLAELKQTPAGTVAVLHYLVSEQVDGYLERVANSDKGRPPFGLKMACFGYGEFLIEKGHWLRQVLILSYDGKGQASGLHKQHLFALQLKQ